MLIFPHAHLISIRASIAAPSALNASEWINDLV